MNKIPKYLSEGKVYDSHYKWLHDHLKDFFKKLKINWYDGIISAHGDKGYGYKDKWENAGIHFYHGMAIYLATYCRPYSQEVRETKNGWVDVGDWIVKNKNRFIKLLPKIKELKTACKTCNDRGGCKGWNKILTGTLRLKRPVRVLIEKRVK